MTPRPLARLPNCRRGNFGIMAALIMPALIGAAGIALDFSQALLVKSQLQDAADAALLNGVAPTSKIMAAALQSTAEGEVAAPTAEVEGFFKAAMHDSRFAKDIAIDTIKTNRKDGALLATMIYKASVPTTLSRIFGYELIAVSGIATVTTPLPLFRDYYVLLDNSPSMGVAATVQDIALMEKKTPGKCAFACHTTETGGEDNYQIARANKVKLRIDLLEKAAQVMIETSEEKRAYPSQYRFAMYNLGSQISTPQLTLFSEMTYPSKALQENLSTLQLMSLRRHGERDHAGTELFAAMSTLVDLIGNQGTGKSAANPLKTIIVVTDGLENSRKQNCAKPKVPSSGVCQEPLDDRVCDTAKKKGIDVAILYTTYLPLPDDSWYRHWISPFQSEIGKRLGACSSKDMFIEATFKDDLAKAMSALFEKTLGSSRVAE
ncbi:UNVERIFIED_ORG: pilus assembly protein (plasmid) [Roseateles sp. XES5]|nr:TadE/TadG family type IV pilus assembly protein [Roseateles sp. XES5]